MHRFEIEQLATSLYEELDINPALPPGLYRTCLRAWGAPVIRYEDECSGRAIVGASGWELSVPRDAKSVTLNLCIAKALAFWCADRAGLTLCSEDVIDLSYALLIPQPALRHDVLIKGLGARDVAQIYNVPLEVAIFRVRRLLDHGSGERPSVPDALAKLI
jgi:hypothetical protein